MKNKKKNGFTLVELMIVMAIMGILAGIAIPNYREYKQKQEGIKKEEQAKNNDYEKAFNKETKQTIKF